MNVREFRDGYREAGSFDVGTYEPVQAEVYECERCRALTMDREAHGLWHRRIGRMFRAAGASLTVNGEEVSP